MSAPLREEQEPFLPPVTVEEVGPGGEACWDELVRSLPGGSPFHLMGWRRAVVQSFGQRSFYLLARRGNEATGLLPLFESPLPLGGRALVSVPFGIRGGALASDASAVASLLARARELASARGARYVELRSLRDANSGWQPRGGYVTFRADLRQDESALLARMERKRRQMIAHAERAGFVARAGTIDELPRFYDLFARSMRRHGTPVHGRRFVAALARALGDDVRLFFLERGGRASMAVLALLFADGVTPFWAGREDGRQRGGEELLYWTIMRWARERGIATFDFGRSRRGTGAYDFKRRWGMEEVALEYRYTSMRPGDAPGLDPGNPRFRRWIALWRRLPLALTRVLGPPLAARIP